MSGQSKDGAATAAPLTLAELRAWVDARGLPSARMGRHVGYLVVQRTFSRGAPVRESVYLRDIRRGARSQYKYVFEHNLPRLEIKVGARYLPAADVVRAEQ